MSMFDAAEVLYPYRTAFDYLSSKNPENYKIFDVADWDYMETFINICSPLKILIMIVRFKKY